MSIIKNSSENNTMFTQKDLFNLIMPIFIELLLATSIGIVDTMMVSNVGEAVVSGVALVDSLNMLLINIFSAVATGASVVISQYIGSNDKHTANIVACQSVISSMLLSSAIMIICLISGDNLLILLFGKSEQSVLDNASIYFILSAISYPFLAVHGTCSAIFRSIRKSRITMYVSILMNVINITGNAILIFGFNMGAAGAAISTLIARIIGSIIMIYLLSNKKDKVINIRGIFPLKLQFDILSKIFKIGIPAGTETVIFQLGKVITQNYIVGFGTAAITANAVSGNIFSLTSMPGSALNLAIITIVGQCIGANRYKEAKSYIIKITIAGTIFLTITNIMTLLLSGPALSLYGISEEATIISKELIFYSCFAQSTLWSIAFILPNGLRGSGDVKYTMIVSILTMWIFRVGLGYILAVNFGFGVLGIWLSMIVDWIFRSIFFVIRFISNKWMTKKVI